jgi:hypothetical protein
LKRAEEQAVLFKADEFALEEELDDNVLGRP